MEKIEMQIGVTAEMRKKVEEQATEQCTSVNGLINRWISLCLQKEQQDDQHSWRRGLRLLKR